MGSLERPPSPPHPGAPIAALVAEDDLASQVLARAVLERAGVVVTVVGDGAAAIAAWESGHYDIVFLDHHMPRLSGLEVAQQIRDAERDGQRGKTPLIAITASGMPSERQACLDAGMDALLLKPFRLDDLVALLARWVPGQRQ